MGAQALVSGVLVHEAGYGGTRRLDFHPKGAGIIQGSLDKWQGQATAAELRVNLSTVEIPHAVGVLVEALPCLGTPDEEDVAGFRGAVFGSDSGLRVKKCVRNRGFSRIDL